MQNFYKMKILIQVMNAKTIGTMQLVISTIKSNNQKMIDLKNKKIHGTRCVKVIVTGNEYGDPCSNPGQDCSHFT